MLSSRITTIANMLVVSTTALLVCLCATMITPANALATSNKFNFGIASSKSSLLFGVEAPGVPMKPGGSYNDPQSVPTSIVDEWIDHLQENDIKRTLCLLKPDELECYSDPGYVELCKAGGVTPTVVNVFDPDASTKVVEAYQQAMEAGEKIAVHCSGGEGRTGVVMGAILVSEGLVTSSEEAETDILATAEQEGVNRKPAAAKIDKLLKDGTLA